MLRFMDWSVVAMGGALVLASLGVRWWERTRGRKGAGLDQGRRFLGAWFPLLLGLGMIGTRVPHLLFVPHPVLMIVDTLNVVSAITVLVLVLRAGFWARGPRAHE